MYFYKRLDTSFLCSFCFAFLLADKVNIIKISSSEEFLVESGWFAVEMMSYGLLEVFVALLHNNYFIVTIIVEII